MYLRILKKDLRRKRTMNTILLLFILLASMFIASSANNMLSIMTALEGYFEKANVPDYWFATTEGDAAQKQFQIFAEENGYGYECEKQVQIDPKNVLVDGEVLDYGNTFLLSTAASSAKVFDSRDREIRQVKDGEIYVTSPIFHSDGNEWKIGSKVKITANGVTKNFILKDYTKDALYGSAMMGVTRCLISESVLAEFMTEDASFMYEGYVYTEDENFYSKFYDLGLNVLFDADIGMLNLMYIMDLIIAAVILIVSVCLILISMVILRFTIHFTIHEDFREIGVMKAIGLKNEAIQGLYIVKYFAISVVGAAVGFVLSIPFGKMLLSDVSRNIILSNKSGVLPNLICTVLTAGIVILFCRSCTGKIKRFSPIDAIRNGQSGERFHRKSIIRLGKSRLSPIPYIAVNDIFSEMRKFIMMVVIFTLGLLLIIIPINTVNTLQSDRLITWFNMAECDHVIQNKSLNSFDSGRKTELEEELQKIREVLAGHNISADVFQEEVFRMTVVYRDKKTTSLSFRGIGDITDDRYVYTEGTPPQNDNEVAITGVVADRIEAHIGDSIEIGSESDKKKYIITALFQSMNNLGEGIRFYHGEELNNNFDNNSIQDSFGIQIRYTDSPDRGMLEERKELLKTAFPDAEIYDPGEYVNMMIGDIAGQLESIKGLILFVVLGINMLVTVLMVKSFIAKEKAEIAILKAIGFKNSAIVAWQSLRIGIVLLIAAVCAVILSTPLSQLTVGPVFRMMGAQSIEFEVKPLEVFVEYPLIVFAVTVLAGMLTALQARKIKASETANIE